MVIGLASARGTEILIVFGTDLEQIVIASGEHSQQTYSKCLGIVNSSFEDSENTFTALGTLSGFRKML